MQQEDKRSKKCKIKKNERGKSKKQYTQDQLKNALEAVSTGVPLRKAAETFGVPSSTLFDKKSDKVPSDKKSGPSTKLSRAEENQIAEWVLDRATRGFPITKSQLLDSVQVYVTKLKGPDIFRNDNRPGRRWYERFMKEHPDISVRIAQNLASERFQAERSRL